MGICRPVRGGCRCCLIQLQPRSTSAQHELEILANQKRLDTPRTPRCRPCMYSTKQTHKLINAWSHYQIFTLAKLIKWMILFALSRTIDVILSTSLSVSVETPWHDFFVQFLTPFILVCAERPVAASPLNMFAAKTGNQDWSRHYITCAAKRA